MVKKPVEKKNDTRRAWRRMQKMMQQLDYWPYESGHDK